MGVGFRSLRMPNKPATKPIIKVVVSIKSGPAASPAQLANYRAFWRRLLAATAREVKHDR
ncbi:unnamed protein product [marine sediment metagenome]|uniref:Uncharacterized protein n=1 Tax=marine sediment metagenome TaxID=412755 RepID=X0TLR7_9ZZZZ